jgi:hypothetical protein
LLFAPAFFPVRAQDVEDEEPDVDDGEDLKDDHF